MELLAHFVAVGIIGVLALGLLIPTFKIIDYAVDHDWHGAKALIVAAIYAWVYVSLLWYGWTLLKRVCGEG